MEEVLICMVNITFPLFFTECKLCPPGVGIEATDLKSSVTFASNFRIMQAKLDSVFSVSTMLQWRKIRRTKCRPFAGVAEFSPCKKCCSGGNTDQGRLCPMLP